MDVTQKIIEHLKKHGMKYQLVEHEPTPTSKDAARVRGTSEEMGAKALVFRSKGNFIMCVLPGNKKVDYSKMRRILGTNSLSLAERHEVEEETETVPGGVPPFGNLFDMPVYADKSLFRNERIAFNAGKQTVSIIMNSIDYRKAVEPIIEEFCE